MESDRLIGQRIREHRDRQGRNQSVVAGLCGISEDYLSRIERGKKTPTLPVLMAISRELRVPVAVLLGDTSAPETTSHESFIEQDVAQALLGYADGHNRPLLSPSALRKAVEGAWRTWQTSKTRFTDASAVLPCLITDVENAVRFHRTGTDIEAKREVLRCAADLYFLLRSYCRRTGRGDLSLMVADRGMRAAEDADDPLRIAAAQWNLGHILLGTDEPEAAAEVAARGIERLVRTPQANTAAMVGALHLVAVVADCRRKNFWAARDRLREQAAPQGERVGDGNVLHTVFGPTNVALHAVSLDMEAGESSAALNLADSIDTNGLPLERQFTFQLEVARCWDLRKEDAAVLVHLLDLEELAPEDLARSPLARQMITDLRKCVRATYRKQVVGLAERVGVH
ncbi:helix-turn-helix transcriptional regulator [Streptomyces sp. CBMA29]|uniref:helix-turn-helix domain-containing protein n=1 Tax=Streptomyces sp. CBMA29 TaxID=1896314 RepID=UPI002948BA80|nr:helix-turn-helix transcriptional regulator [Streptomyces sp. CBMA29]MBD0737811.1 transcriptional regulator [Streptomyces sp. CBMA29]